MVNPLDNKKIAELVIENPEAESGYEKINPKSLATIIYENHPEQQQTIEPTVQSHIDNKDIHFSKEGYKEELKSTFIDWDGIVGEGATSVEYDTQLNKLKISTTIPESSAYLTRNSVKPQDESITITNIEGSPRDFYIRANIPDVSNFLVSSNIRALDDTIYISRDRYSNNVYLKTNPIEYQAGTGLKIINGTIYNTAPNKPVYLYSGDNINIEEDTTDTTRQQFTISARNKLNVGEWIEDYKYVEGDIVIHNNGLYRCNKLVSEKSAFDPNDWSVIADYSATREMLVTGDSPTSVLNLRDFGIEKRVTNSDTMIINVGGIIPLKDTYELRPSGTEIEFVEPIPAHTPVEIMILSNSVLNSLDPTANINDWAEHTFYCVGNIVIYNNALYKCVVEHSSTEQFDVSNWQILMNYTKDVYEFDTTSPTSSIELPVTIDDKNDISINIGNTVLMQSSYLLEEDSKTITFSEPIEANTKIEVTVYTHGVQSLPQIPDPKGNKDMMLISNNNGTAYKTISKYDLLKKLNLSTLTEMQGHENCIIGVDSDSDNLDYRFYTDTELSGKVKIRNTTNGFNVLNSDEIIGFETENLEEDPENPVEGYVYYNTVDKVYRKYEDGAWSVVPTTDNIITFGTGSTLSEDESVLLRTYVNITKDFSARWEYGSNKGSLLDGEPQDIEWDSGTSVIITKDDDKLQKRVTANYQKTDREAWRAMDEFTTTGNGWQTETTTAIWQYAHPKPIKVTKLKFRNQKMYGTSNTRSKDIDIWVSDDSSSYATQGIKVGSFTANEDSEEQVINITNPTYGRVFGLEIKNSYGTGVGALHIEMEGFVGNNMKQNDFGYIYVIGNEKGNLVDIATSYYDKDEIGEHLPEGFKKFKQIGKFFTNQNTDIWDVFPLMDLNSFYVNRQYVDERELNNFLHRYDREIEHKVEDYIESEGVYTKNEINAKFEEKDEEINARVIKTSDSNKIYGTDSNGNAKFYNRTEITKVEDIKIGDTTAIDSNRIAVLGTMAGENMSSYYNKSTADSKFATQESSYTATQINDLISDLQTQIADAKQAAIDAAAENLTLKLKKAYPKGSIYISTSSTNPNLLFGFGTWVQKSEGRVLQGVGTLNGNTYTAGQNYNAGLPNITGSARFREGHGTLSGIVNTSGCISGTDTGRITYPNGGADVTGNYARTFNINANGSSGIYGNSTTVQPPSYAVYIFERIDND